MSIPALFLPPGCEQSRSTPPPFPRLSLLVCSEVERVPPDEDGTAACTFSDVEPHRHKADRRLWRARQGEPGVYRAYPTPDEKIIFRVWAVRHHNTGDRITRVYLVSHWNDGELIRRFRRDEPQPYLPLRVLSGRFRLNTIPEEYREVLAPIAHLFTQAAKSYDQQAKEWRQRSR